MSLNLRETVGGLRIGKSASTTIDTLGEVQANSTDNKLAFHNGTSASYILTETHAASGSNRVQNKELDDSSVLFVDNSDTTKKLAFQLSGITTGTTRTFTIPDTSGSFVVTGGQTFGATLSIGTTDAQALSLITNNTVRLTVASTGAITIASGTLQGPSAATFIVTAQSGQNLDLNTNGTLISAKTTLNLEALLRGTTTSDATTTGSAATLTLPTTHIHRLTNASLVSLAGIGAGASGQHLVLVNDTTASISILDESGSATAANRILTGTNANVTVAYRGVLLLVYESNSARWRVVGGSGGTSLIAPLSKTANYTVTTADETILGNASGGEFTLTLPAASANSGRKYIFKKTDSTVNGVIIDGNSTETIDGLLTYVLTIQYESITIISDGSNWHII